MDEFRGEVERERERETDRERERQRHREKERRDGFDIHFLQNNLRARQSRSL